MCDRPRRNAPPSPSLSPSPDSAPAPRRWEAELVTGKSVNPNPILRTDDVTRTVYSTDNSIYQVRPTAVSLPKSRDDVADLIRTNAVRATPLAIVARGGGTGTNGQSLTNGLVIDLKRDMFAIESIDVETQTAVVQPGVVAGVLNAELREHNLVWAPHTSTLNRATVGGMIATDAAGKGSLVYGRTHRHVRSLEVCLDDGTFFLAEPLTVEQAEQRAATDDRAGQIWRALLDLPISEHDDFGFPELARGFSGYGLDRLRYDGMIDPLALLVGAEGTLGVTTRAALSLSRLPSHTTLIVAAYSTFAAALEDSVELRSTLPTAIETFDQRTLEAGRSSPAWPVLSDVVGEHSKAVLLLEYSGDRPIDGESIHQTLAANGRSIRSTTVTSTEEQKAAWKVRADAAGLLARTVDVVADRVARPTAMVEDCAVPVSAMVDFIADFRNALDRFGVDYAMYGHADVGCVHVRPSLDISDPTHESLVKQITAEVTSIVRAHGGILWGEHGRGFRGDAATELLSPDTIALMRRVKSIFDPADVFNPGKLYRPVESSEDIVPVDGAPMRGQADRAVPVTIRREYGDAFACNGNGLCHSHAENDVMCPSFKATGDPALSPKGRSDLLRSVLARRVTPGYDPGDSTFEDEVAQNLSECLSCAACTGTCPVEVDIPELKSQFLDSYYETRQRPRSHTLLSKFETFAGLSGRAARLAKYNTKQAGKALGLVDLPSPAAATRPNHHPNFHARKNNGPFDVVLLRDVFTDRLEPDTILAAGDLLADLGLRVALSPFVASGKFDHVQGKRSSFGRAVRAQRGLIEDITGSGAIPVAIEPATALMHGHEYPKFDASYPRAVRHLVDVLYDNRSALTERAAPAGRQIALLGHCTERATRPENLDRWVAVLDVAGYETSVPELGCCGMAGLFGHEDANQDMSRALWGLGWEDTVRRNDVVATGYSCRSQAQRFSGQAPPHPVHLLSSSE